MGIQNGPDTKSRPIPLFNSPISPAVSAGSLLFSHECFLIRLAYVVVVTALNLCDAIGSAGPGSVSLPVLRRSLKRYVTWSSALPISAFTKRRSSIHLRYARTVSLICDTTLWLDFRLSRDALLTVLAVFHDMRVSVFLPSEYFHWRSFSSQYPRENVCHVPVLGHPELFP